MGKSKLEINVQLSYNTDFNIIGQFFLCYAGDHISKWTEQEKEKYAKMINLGIDTIHIHFPSEGTFEFKKTLDRLCEHPDNLIDKNKAFLRTVVYTEV
ncbi:MAG: hypothetical protein PHF86_14035 [Candidatus Nanoarchaeia archaeon]|nr:hypothetical protein [Candidatus Nanoarchaeia archaeon]